MSNDYPFTSSMKSCDEVYNFEKMHPSPESIARAKMLDDTLYYAKFDDSYYLELENKMIIMQDETYSTKQVHHNNFHYY